tara:strand:- start:1704 stop:2831 length:1128 start_codon:yes stop_codon:yes gene_type:complete
MRRIKLILDNKISKPNNSKKLYNIVNNYSKDYNKYKDLQVDNFINSISLVKPKLIITKMTMEYNKPIHSIQDLLDLINHVDIIENVNYNFDIKALYKIKDSLIKLNNLIGMQDLKNDVLNQLLFYVQNLHTNGGLDFMHTVLYGSPGTGKTEVAKIIGAIFSDLGILPKKTFKKVVRSDLIAGYLGQTALKTNKVIQESLGGVLFIDEAYALGNDEKRDSFAKECIDTLCEALSNHKDNLMVIIAGYEKELNSCFFNFNPGLRSRFPWVFKTDNYTAGDLKDIFFKKVNDIKWTIDSSITETFFKENMKYFHFYGRDMEVLLLKTKIAHGRRVFSLNNKTKTHIVKEDIEYGLKLFIKNNYEVEQVNNTILHLYN